MGRTDTDLLKKIGATVSHRIREKGYRSVELFAHETGIPQSVLSRLIAGSRGVSLSTFIKIAKALDVGLDELSAPAMAQTKTKRAQDKNSQEKNPAKGRKRKLVIDWDGYDRLEIKGQQESGQSILIELRKTKKTS